MKNKMLFLLPLFLFTTTTQCMKRSFSQITLTNDTPQQIKKKVQEKTIHDLKLERDTLKEIIERNRWDKVDYCRPLYTCIHPQQKYTYAYLISNMFNPRDYFETEPLDRRYAPISCSITLLKDIHYQEALYQDYSALGAASMAEGISFQQKKEFMQRLQKAGCIATYSDKKFITLELWERRYALPLIPTICALQQSPLFSKTNVPQDIINYITLLMWETEESLL
jgi:hypothetical protein